MNANHDENTKWLHSPVSEKLRRLQPMHEIELQPYLGGKRKLKIFRTQVLIGQSADCDIQIEDPFLSPVHAELRLARDGSGYSVHDLHSRNGVFLNGVRVDSAPLPSRGTLRVGRSFLRWLEPGLDHEDGGEGWVVADPAMKSLLDSLRRVAQSALPVLLLGETGTGKDVLARLLHRWSQSGKGPYIPVNGALTGGNLAESELFGHARGAFTGAENARLGALRSAHGGSLFLDEIADVPACAQVKLLRALETGEVKALGSDRAERTSFRLISATSRDIDQSIQEGTFRLDLYYRVAGFVVHVPPLRERPLDILAIARKQVRESGLELDREAENRLLSYTWPGNVRELRAGVERAVVAANAHASSCILADHFEGLSRALPPALARSPRTQTLEELERQILLSSLERNGWGRVATANELGIARSTLHAKMRRFHLRDEAMAKKPY